MKKNKKGFTLIELLATIVLLGIVITIAVTSFSSVQDTIQKKQRENIISKVKVAAKKYVNDTDIKKVYIETLIQEGYIEADDERNQIIAPDTKESLNCYYIDYTSGEAVVTEGHETDGTCDYEEISDAILNVKYCVINVGGTCSESDYVSVEDGWIDAKGKDVYLKVGNVPPFLTEAQFRWISPLAPDVYHEGKEYKIDTGTRNYIDDVYQVMANSDGKTYTADVRIKIDLKEPIVQDISIEKPTEWAQKKKISASIIDNESGLSGYKITTSSVAPTSGWNAANGKSKNIEIEVNENGIYYIWVKDDAGNVNQGTIDHSLVNASKIDSIAPSCVHSGDNEEWTNQNVTITWGCDDGIGLSSSGCSTASQSGSKTFNVTTEKSTIESYVIKDNVGNERTCAAREAKVYVDKTAPTCTDSGDSTSWTKENRTINWGCKDDHSGCDSKNKGGSTSFTSTTKTAIISSYKIKDKAGNETTCKERTANVYVDKTAPTCTDSGDSTTWTKNDRTINWGCEDDQSGCDSKNKGGSTSFTSTTKTAIILSYTIKDKVGNSKTCSKRTANVYVDKTAPTCTDSGDSTTWTKDDRTIYWGCSDSHSGCDTTASGASKAYTATTKTASISSYTIKDNVGNSKTCSKRTANVYVDKTAPTVSSFTITSKNNSYNSIKTTLTVKGSDDNSGLSKICISTSDSYSGCSWKDFTGTYTIDYKFNSTEGSGSSFTLYAFIKDNVGNVSSGKSKKYTIYKLCDDEVIYDYGEWGSCSASCGGGYKYRDVYYEDEHFGNFCRIEEDGDASDEKCNTQACCSIGTYEYDYCSDYGYKVYSRYNECKGKWEYDTRYEEYCSGPDIDCSWGSCESDGKKRQYCDYYYGGTLFTYEADSKTCSSEPVAKPKPDYNFCNNSGDSLFGSSKGTISGNYGTAVYPTPTWGNWCHANGKVCNASIGYNRICITSVCGSYKDMTAIEINKSLGCDYASYWCTC